jgi:pyruvate dehydrogenase (quinone)
VVRQLDLGEFMTAVHHKLPVKIIIYNNSALELITLEAESAGLAPFREAIEFPNPDFAALARACGGYGFTARRPSELRAAISEAFAIIGPAIVDAVVVANEMPNIPHIELEQVGHFAMGKIKEAVLAVVGG